LLFWKIAKIVATRCQILWPKCTKFDFGWGSDPDPAGGAYSAPPDPLAGFKEAYFSANLFTGRMPRRGKLPVLNLLKGQKISFFFAPQGRLAAPIQVKLGRADGHLGPLGCAKFHPNRHRGWERGPKISKISTFW